MVTRQLKATLGLAAIALALGSCGLSAGDATGQDLMRGSGPPDAPVKLYYEDAGHGSPVLLIHGFGAKHLTPGATSRRSSP